MKLNPAIGLVLAIGTIVCTGSVAGADPSEFGDRGRRLDRLSQELNLTADQEAQIRAIFADGKANTEADRAALAAARQDMTALLTGDASEAELRQQHDLIQDLRAGLGDRRFEGVLDVREVLTPEQRDRFAELAAERRQRRRGFQGAGPRL
ncbi:MAG: Spy/CpxP family protein refolding chaperone [Cyanobacteria bacterium J06641_5]